MTQAGYQLFMTYRLGYHLPVFGSAQFVEPQMHFTFWPLDSEGPKGFAEVEDRWNNYFLFEPNVYVGVRF